MFRSLVFLRLGAVLLLLLGLARGAGGLALMIEPPSVGDVVELREIALRSKAHWGYDANFMARFADLLAVSGDYLRANLVWVARRGSVTLGWCSLVRLVSESDGSKALLLDDLWVLPEAIGTGLGRGLLERALEEAANLGAREVRLDSDPNAVGFYEHFGFEVVGENDGGLGRMIPHMVKHL